MSKILQTIIPLILLVLIFNSCTDGTIDPIEHEGSVFSFYGYVTVGESPNYVRIRDLRKPLLSEESEFDGTVTFEDIETGEVTTLEDTVVNFDGNYTHNFRIPNEIKPDNAYLLKAVRSDGETTQSIATTPKVTVAEYQPDNVQITCEKEMTLIFKNVVPPETIAFEIHVFHDGQEHSADLDLFADQLEYVGEDEMHINLSPRNLLVEIFTPRIPDVPNFDMYLLHPTVACQNISSPEFEIKYTHFGPEWGIGKPFRKGGIDFESGDVENGLGFFGAIGEGSFNIDFTN